MPRIRRGDRTPGMPCWVDVFVLAASTRGPFHTLTFHLERSDSAPGNSELRVFAD